MTVNPHSVRFIKTLAGSYAVYARSRETLTEVLIGVVRKDPRGWILQPTDKPDDWIGFWTTRAEAADSLVWRVNRVPV